MILYYYTFIILHFKKGSTMEITGTTNQIQDYINQEAKVQETEAAYQVKLLKMQQESDAVVGDILEDTCEISQEALNKCLAEIGK